MLGAIIQAIIRGPRPITFSGQGSLGFKETFSLFVGGVGGGFRH